MKCVFCVCVQKQQLCKVTNYIYSSTLLKHNSIVLVHYLDYIDDMREEQPAEHQSRAFCPPCEADAVVFYTHELL